MKKYQVYCVIDRDGYYLTLINAQVERDMGTGEEVVTPEYYRLSDGESLVLRTDDCRQPTIRIHAGADGFIRPRWDDDAEAWVEGATAEETAAWEAEHPAPEPVASPPTTEELAEENKLLRAQLAAASDRQEFMEDCVAELAGQVYNV